MQCFIYKSARKEELYIYLDKRDDFSAVPDVLLQTLGKLNFVMELQLSPDRKLAREDAGKVIASIKNKGFFIQMPPVIAYLSATTPVGQQPH
ncbi:MAG: YcgL domain-containing protein [Methylococcales bacterium]|nr:YcgL domain-containing protein [Methylococcales bacterium]